MISAVMCGTYPVDEARRELVAMRDEVDAESVWLAALTADQRARARDRALRRLPADLHTDVRQVFRRAELRAGTGFVLHRNHHRSSGVRQQRAPASGCNKAAALGSTSLDDEPPEDGVGATPRPRTEHGAPASAITKAHVQLTDAELSFLDFIADASVRMFFNATDEGDVGT